jgi:hypothetical protein
MGRGRRGGLGVVTGTNGVDVDVGVPEQSHFFPARSSGILKVIMPPCSHHRYYRM